MLFATIGQPQVFLWMTFAGMFIGALYALFRAARRLICAGFWFTLCADVLFGLTAGLALCAALVVGSYGEVRLYELGAAAIGAAMFYAGVCTPCCSLLARFGRTLRKRIQFLKQNHLIKVIFK